MPTIIPRWEWRTFGTWFGAGAERNLADQETTGIQESDEIYLLSNARATTTIRGASSSPSPGACSSRRWACSWSS